MKHKQNLNRRRFIQRGVESVAALAVPLPLWAQSAPRTPGNGYAHNLDLSIGSTPIRVAGSDAIATGINGTVPGPLLRWREGETVSLEVRNALTEPSSIHWHGLLLPSHMDGVPGLSFPGIPPGGAYRYEFKLRQNGTYWYHSHSEFQEQTGVYGPIIIEPETPEPFAYDAEYVLLLSDWTFEDPTSVMANLKMRDDYYNYNRRTAAEFFADVRKDGWAATRADRAMWGAMRMKASDIADITAASYTYLLNGHDADQNWTANYEPGQRLRLRIINGSAQTFFNFRIPGLPMEVVQVDGQNVDPVVTDEFQIGVAETYDVLVDPAADRAYTLFAESMDRSGYVRGTLSPDKALTAAVPPLRRRLRVTMRDMGMNHDAMGHGEAHHGMHDHHAERERPGERAIEHRHKRGPGVANLVENPLDRLAEPGQGLGNEPHRVLRYSQLRSLDKNTDSRSPGRELEIHLTGNMERYMWSFDGIKYSEVSGPIRFIHGERLRLTLVNDTMMSHPIHLHGMFMELVNGNGAHNPRKHTVVVKPAERLSLDITASEAGHWAFHCHMLYHMKAGMMHSVRVEGPGAVS